MKSPDPEHLVQTIRIFLPATVKGKQGWIFQAKHGKGGHQYIGQSNAAVAGTMVLCPVKILAYASIESVGIEVTAHFDPAKRFA